MDKDRQKDIRTGNREREAVSMGNMDEEGRKDTLTGDEYMSWRGGGKEEQ